MVPPNESATQQIETDHQDLLHDAQVNYFGNRLATCSSDRTIKIFDVSSSDASGPAGQHKLIDTLRGHEGPVWQVSWGHPKFGHILASCSYDGKVLVWKEIQQGAPWQKIKEHTLHNASVNSLSWAPHELGAILACASSDGKVSVLTFNDDGTWDASLFTAHATGVNAISWAPAVIPGALLKPTSPVPNTGATAAHSPQFVKKFATGGCDAAVKVWAWKEESKTWVEETTLEGHTDWVRDVAWQPNIGLPKSYLATASQDKTVIVHVHDASPGASAWTRTSLDPQNTGSADGSKFPDTVWRVSWSVAGGVLAVSSSDKITLWKESLKGKFELVSDLDA